MMYHIVIQGCHNRLNELEVLNGLLLNLSISLR